MCRSMVKNRLTKYRNIYINSMASFAFSDWIEWRPFHNDRPWQKLFFCCARVPLVCDFLFLLLLLASPNWKREEKWLYGWPMKLKRNIRENVQQHSTHRAMCCICAISAYHLSAPSRRPVPFHRVCQNGHALARDAETSWCYTLAATLCAAYSIIACNIIQSKKKKWVELQRRRVYRIDVNGKKQNKTKQKWLGNFILYTHIYSLFMNKKRAQYHFVFAVYIVAGTFAKK